MSTFPVFRVAAGAVFILSGAFAYYEVNFGASLALVLVIAGAAILVAVFVGHKSHPADIALFVIALIVLGVAGSGFSFQTGTGPEVASYSALSSEIPTNNVTLLATTTAGSISIDFSPNASLGYQVTFRKILGFQFFPPLANYSLTHSLRKGVLFLNASGSDMSIDVTLGQEYFTNIIASTGAGSISLASIQNVSLGSVSLDSGAGSITANIAVKNVSSLDISTGAGSIDFTSSYLRPSYARVPITISTGTGSLTFKARFTRSTAVSLNASAGLGSISQNLPGFLISKSSSGSLSASAGNMNAEDAFLVSLSTGTGSLDVIASFA